MKERDHIHVIGAGLMGLSTADSLRTRGFGVTVYEIQDGPGKGAGFNNSGMIHPSQSWPWLEGDFGIEAAQVLKLARESRVRLAQRLKDLNVRAEASSGCIQIFDDLEQLQRLESRYDDMGVTYENVTGLPHVFGHFALRFPEDFCANAYDYTCALATDLADKGVTFRYNQTESDILSLLDSGASIVIAAGMGSVALADHVGVTLPLEGMTGHALNFDKAEIDWPSEPIMHYASRSALTVFKDHLRLSGTVDEGDPACLEDIWRDIAPDLMSSLGEPVSRWSAERPVSKLGRPVIDRISDKVWVNTGHAHMGLTLCAGSGEWLADMMAGQDQVTSFKL